MNGKFWLTEAWAAARAQQAAGRVRDAEVVADVGERVTSVEHRKGTNVVDTVRRNTLQGGRIAKTAERSPLVRFGDQIKAAWNNLIVRAPRPNTLVTDKLSIGQRPPVAQHNSERATAPVVDRFQVPAHPMWRARPPIAVVPTARTFA
jgi:hypothetical protein